MRPFLEYNKYTSVTTRPKTTRTSQYECRKATDFCFVFILQKYIYINKSHVNVLANFVVSNSYSLALVKYKMHVLL